MPVSVYMMSGDIITIDIFDGFRVRNLRNEVYLSLRGSDYVRIDNSDRLVFSKVGEEENESRSASFPSGKEEVDDYDFVNDGDIFRVFVKPIEDIPSSRVRLTLHNNIICLRNYEGVLIDYYGWEIESRLDEFLDIERMTSMPDGKIVLEVDIKEDGYEIMRQDIISSSELDNYEESIDDIIGNNRIFEIFFNKFMRFNDNDIVDIVYVNEDDEDDEDDMYDPEDDVDGDQPWD